MVLPVLKLALLAVKQVSKPVANRIKSATLRSAMLQKTMVDIGQRVHYNAYQIGLIADGEGAMDKSLVPKLQENAAAEKGADFVAEMFVYAVSAGALGVEQWYSRRKERGAEEAQSAKEAAKEAEARQLSLYNEQKLWAAISSLHQTVAELQHRVSAAEESEARRQRERRWFGSS